MFLWRLPSMDSGAAARRGCTLPLSLVAATSDGLPAEVSAAAVRRWRFFLQELAHGHWVSVARGPPENIVDAWREFTGTLEQPVIPVPEFQARACVHCMPI